MKIGSYEIPDYRLTDTLIEATKKIFDTYRSETAPDSNVVATLLGHKSASGAFLSKIASLRSYGLVEKRGIKVTELGKRIVYPTGEEDKNDAFSTAIFNIPLWKELYKTFGINLPKENFWANLNKITGLESPDSKKLEEPVRNAYIEDLKNLKTVQKPAPPADSKPLQTRAGEADDRKNDMDTSQLTSPKSGVIPFAQFAFGESKVVIFDRTALEVIIGQLNTLKTVLDKQAVSPATSGDNKGTQEKT